MNPLKLICIFQDTRYSVQSSISVKYFIAILWRFAHGI